MQNCGMAYPFVTWAEGLSTETVGEDLFFGLHLILGRKTDLVFGLQNFDSGLHCSQIFWISWPPFRKSCAHYCLAPMENKRKQTDKINLCVKLQKTNYIWIIKTNNKRQQDIFTNKVLQSRQETAKWSVFQVFESSSRPEIAVAQSDIIF